MKKTALVPLQTCTKCEHFKTRHVQCDDSFCRPERWFCKHPDVDPDNDIIDGYHDLCDEDPGIPKFCPFLPKGQREEKLEYEYKDFDRSVIEKWITDKLISLGYGKVISVESFVDTEGEFSMLRYKCVKRK